MPPVLGRGQRPKKQQIRTPRQSAISSDLLLLAGAVKIDFPNLRQHFERITPTGLLAGGAFAPYKRFGPLAQNLGAGAIHLPRAVEIKGWRPPLAAGTQKERTSYRKSFLFGAGDRTRTGTLSPAVDFESTTSTNSITPAGAGLQDSFYIIADGSVFCKENFSLPPAFWLVRTAAAAGRRGARPQRRSRRWRSRRRR